MANVYFKPAGNNKQIDKFLKTVGKSKVSSINMTIYSHGLSSNSEKSPENTSILLDNDRLSIEKLNSIINKKNKTNNTLKNHRTFCHSGAIHQIAQSRKNSCSASASDYKTRSLSELDCFAEFVKLIPHGGLR